MTTTAGAPRPARHTGGNPRRRHGSSRDRRGQTGGKASGATGRREAVRRL